MSDLGDRKNGIRGNGPRGGGGGRRSIIATNVSRQTNRAKKAEILNEALFEFVVLLFERDDVGYTSFDLDGRILICAPWSKRNHRRWGLRRLEANVLRHILISETKNEKREPLFILDNFHWYLNLAYRGKSQAMAWVETINIDARRWEKGRLAVTDEKARQWAN